MIGESFTRRRRRYSRDLQPCRRTRFSTRCAWNIYNDPRNEQFETETISPHHRPIATRASRVLMETGPKRQEAVQL